MALPPSQLDRQALKDAVDRLLGQALSDVMAQLLVELRRQGQKSGALLNPRSVPVGTNPVIVAETNPRRLEIFFSNNQAVSGQQVFLGGRGVTTGPIGDPNAGIVINPGALLPFGDASTVGEWWAVCSGGPFDLRVMEVLTDAPAAISDG